MTDRDIERFCLQMCHAGGINPYERTRMTAHSTVAVGETLPDEDSVCYLEAWWQFRRFASFYLLADKATAIQAGNDLRKRVNEILKEAQSAVAKDG